MNKQDLDYRLEKLTTINLEIRDYNAYFEKKFKKRSVKFDFGFNIEIIDEQKLEIFLHLRQSYIKKEKKEENLMPLYHSDHILNIVFQNKLKDNSFEVSFIAHLLGTAIIMTKGYYDNITRGFLINEVRLPVFNPTELLHAKYDEIIEDNVITFDL